MKIFSKLAIFLFTVACLATACDVKEEPFIEGADDAKAIEQFVVDGVEGVIDEAAKTVTLTFGEDADLTHMVPTIKVSTYATVEPASGVPQNFSEPVVYTVKAFNGTTAQYQVTAEVYNAQSEKRMLSFRLEEPAAEGVINETAKTVTLSLPNGTDVTNLVPIIEVSEGATVEPASGVAQDFTNPVTYTVTAQDGSTVGYTVTAIVSGNAVEPTGKTVLIKDFTGARCVNCPAAADYAHNLQHQLDEEHIIILSVHAGYLAQPVGQFPNFITDEGTAWYNNNSSNPLFSVDHVSLSEGNTLFVEQLDSSVGSALAEEQQFEIVINNSYDAASRQLNVSAQLIALSDMQGDYHVTVCLVEDNIVGRQIIPGGVNTEYVFRNVFRGTLNGADGASFASGAVEAEQQFPVNYSTELNSEYNADECYVMVYIHDKSQGDKIVQTAMRKVN